MSGPGYTADPLLRRLSAANGWRHDLISNARGELEVMVAVRVGAVWTDSVAIAGEDQTVAMRHRTNDDRLILPAELPSESRAVWRRHGRCAEVLAELFELPDPTGGAS
ncbi:MAG: hypothetical protein ACRDRZ_12660 [Pseudonocardiaceae bacterium]